jgi:NitT/TauT family transport system substrate-binding protein
VSISKRKVIAPLIAGGIALALASCGHSGSSDAGQQITLAKTSQNSLQLILVDIANQEGFFSKHGVQVKVVSVNGDAAAIPALVSGSVQFAVSTSTPLFAAEKKSNKIEAVAPLCAEPPSQIVIAKDVAKQLGITDNTPVEQRIQALKGKHLAIRDVGGGEQYTLNATLSANGLNPADVHVSAIGAPTAILAALGRNKIDAAAPAVPYGFQAVTQGDAVMLADIWSGDVPSIGKLDFELLNVNRGYAKDHPDDVRGVQAALTDAMAYVRNNPGGALKVAKKLLPSFSDSVLKAALGNGNSFPENTDISQQDFQKLADFAKQSGVDPAGVTYAESVWKG